MWFDLIRVEEDRSVVHWMFHHSVSQIYSKPPGACLIALISFSPGLFRQKYPHLPRWNAINTTQVITRSSQDHTHWHLTPTHAVVYIRGTANDAVFLERNSLVARMFASWARVSGFIASTQKLAAVRKCIPHIHTCGYTLRVVNE